MEQIVKEHWKIYGRNYYQRYDYENLENTKANEVISTIKANFETFIKKQVGNTAVDFLYIDKIDHSKSEHQGFIFTYADGSRFVFRTSGTGTVGITIRLYLEKYSADKVDLPIEVALKEIVNEAIALSKIHVITGLKGPHVIT